MTVMMNAAVGTVNEMLEIQLAFGKYRCNIAKKIGHARATK